MNPQNTGTPGKAWPRIVYFSFLGFSLYRHDLGDYMERLVFELPSGRALRLHCILRSDADPDLHDHPFDFTSLILGKGYTEIAAVRAPEKIPQGVGHCQSSGNGSVWLVETISPLVLKTVTRFWPRFSVIRHKAEDLHRLELTEPVYTLVFCGPRRRKWGFQTANGWVEWTDYVSVKS